MLLEEAPDAMEKVYRNPPGKRKTGDRPVIGRKEIE
jgi:hypothetical protein